MNDEPSIHPDDLAELSQRFAEIDATHPRPIDTTSEMIALLMGACEELDEDEGHAAIVIYRDETEEGTDTHDAASVAVVGRGPNPYELLQEPSTVAAFARDEVVGLGIYTYGTATDESGKKQSVKCLVMALPDGLHARARLADGEETYMSPEEIMGQPPTKLALAVMLAWSAAVMMRGQK